MNSKPKVLLVDDDPSMLQLLSLRLGAAGYELITASSGVDALQTMGRENIDAVVTDLRMEEMDGLALFDRLHERWPTVPVIMLTAHGTIREAVTATQKGLFAFLTKPVDKEELLSTLENALSISPQQPQQPEAALPILTRSAKMYSLLEQAKLFSESDVNILINGESGTGKELLATTIHQQSSRSDQPFIAINCSAIPHDLLESELFGHVKGAFTGASQNREGLFVTANGGTILLDEIGDMPLSLQVKLLRVLQEKTVRPVGGSSDRKIDVRVLSATHFDLEAAIDSGEFRSDLYYRLNVVNLKLPALRERPEDIPLLANHFLTAIAERTNKPAKTLSPEAVALLISYHWPGNIRELENIMERVFALSTTPVISAVQAEHALPGHRGIQIDTLKNAKQQFEREYIVQLLTATDGQVSLAAEIAGRNRSDFHKLIKRHGIHVNIYRKSDTEDD
ncbi:sigma-54 dependent transcriptional regulator [Porticoccaceae bacterium LTM1]|nr:sigma-54 dependent transcriptional regulator [Porticoccaceae bacterium LTM1]